MCDESAPKTPEEFLADLDLSGDALNAVALVFAAAEVKVRELHRDFAKVLGPIPFEDVERAAAVVTSCALELLDTAVGACLSKRMPPAIFDDKFTDLAARTERIAESWWLGIIDTFVILDHENRRLKADTALDDDDIIEQASKYEEEIAYEVEQTYGEVLDFTDTDEHVRLDLQAEAARYIATSGAWHPVNRVRRAIQERYSDFRVEAARRYRDALVGPASPTGDKGRPPITETAERALRRKAAVLPRLERKGMTPENWAQKAHVERKTVYNYLSGKTSRLRMSTRVELAACIGMTPEELPE